MSAREERPTAASGNANGAQPHVVTVVSSRVDELRDSLQRLAIPDLVCRYFAAPDEVDDAALQAEIALGAPDVLAPLLQSMPRLQWVQSTWAGVTPFLDAPRRDYLLTGVKSIFGTSMSEYVLGWLLAIERRILEHAAASHWEWRRERGLAGLRLGIAGTGSIGRAVAASCAPFVNEILGLNSDGRDQPGFTRCFPSDRRVDFARGLDALVMILPDTPASTRLVDAEVLAAMAPGSLLLNVGRANSLDHDAVVAALRAGRLRAAVLDVLPEEPLPDHSPLWKEPGLYITSHTAAPTEMDAIVAVFRDNLRRYRDGQPLEGLIDFARGY